MSDSIERAKIEELLAGAKQNRDQHLYNFHAASGVVQILKMLLAPAPEQPKKVRAKREKANAKVKVVRARRHPAGANGIGKGANAAAVGDSHS